MNALMLLQTLRPAQPALRPSHLAPRGKGLPVCFKPLRGFKPPMASKRALRTYYLASRPSQWAARISELVKKPSQLDQKPFQLVVRPFHQARLGCCPFTDNLTCETDNPVKSDIMLSTENTHMRTHR